MKIIGILILLALLVPSCVLAGAPAWRFSPFAALGAERIIPKPVRINGKELHGFDRTPGKLIGASVLWRPAEQCPYLFVEGFGAWSIGRNDFVKVKHAMAGGLSLGIEAELEFIYARAGSGLGFFAPADGFYSSSVFQFPTKIGLGIRSSWADVGVFYLHLSNGGIKSPNWGRNYYGVEATLLTF